MGIVTAGLIQPNEIRERVSRLGAIFPEEVSHIDYRYGQDWSRDDAIFLTVHLTPQGASREGFANLARSFPVEVVMQVGSEDLGLHSYFDFVSDSSR